MSEMPRPPTGPAAFDAVEIVDRLSASHLSATVESANDRTFVLRLKQDARIPDEAHLRWFDGAGAWQAICQLTRIDEARVSCELVTSDRWEEAPARRSVRAPVENSPLRVRVVESKVLARGRRVHAVCIDVSDTGCRVNWVGTTPRIGDAVDITWDMETSYETTPAWVPARVARIIPRPFGAHHVGFSFEIADPAQGRLVREWHQAWLETNRQRSRAHRAA